MKRIFRILMVCAFSLTSAVAAHSQGQGELAVGVDAGYVSKMETMRMGVFAQYGLTDYLRMQAGLNGYLRHQDADALVADVDFQVPLRIAKMPIEIYPFVGVDFASWSIHQPLDDTVHLGRVGANVGAGFEYYFKTHMKFNVELKYVLTRDYSTFVSSAGLVYVF